MNKKNAIMDKDKKMKELSVPTMYKWEPSDQFSLDGQEFSIFFNVLDKMINTPEFENKLSEAQQILGLYSMYNVVKSKLEASITAGIAKIVNPNEQKGIIDGPKELLPENIPVEG